MGVLRACTALLLAGWLAVGAPGQVEGDPAGARQQAPDESAQSLMTIAALVKAIAAKRADIEALQRSAEQAPEPRRLELLAEAAALQKALAEQQRSLEVVATGVDLHAYAAQGDKADLADELERLLRPLVEQLKEITAEPRQVEQLKSELAATTQRLAAVDAGLVRARRLRAQTTDGALVDALDAVVSGWERRREQIESDRQVLHYRLAEKQRGRRSFVETTRSVLGSFFRERGLNLLMALGAFVSVLFGLRLLYRPFARRAARARQQAFGLRLLSVAWHLLAVVLAVGAALLVLYAAADWVLLGLAGLFLLGVLWAGKQAVPRFYQEARLLLNVGEVREQERVVIDGLPWRVDRLHIQTRLVNPALTGGVLRLPLRDLLGLHSRPTSDREPWFPCFEGDWVLVDGQCGCVLVQTPQTVELSILGARRSLPTNAFLAAGPVNLAGGFGFRATFGIDYRHQAIATTRVPVVLTEALQSGLAAVPGGDGLIAARVEFEKAGASSLDYAVVAEFKGPAAQHYLSLQRAVQRLLLEACNDNGWTIPFPQLAVHLPGKGA